MRMIEETDDVRERLAKGNLWEANNSQMCISSPNSPASLSCTSNSLLPTQPECIIALKFNMPKRSLSTNLFLPLLFRISKNATPSNLSHDKPKSYPWVAYLISHSIHQEILSVLSPDLFTSLDFHCYHPLLQATSSTVLKKNYQNILQWWKLLYRCCPVWESLTT